MRNKVFFYLFMFSLLIIVLLFASNNNMRKSADKRIDIAQKRIEIVRDSLHQVEKELDLANYFALENNAVAQEYFNYKTIDSDVQKIEQEVLALNHNAQGNTLVPYGVIDGYKCIINKVQFLNHRWMIADFYAGDQKGEVLIQYFFQDGKPTEFSTIQSVLYTKK
ncbi:hydrolase [Myroides sp. LJL116]